MKTTAIRAMLALMLASVAQVDAAQAEETSTEHSHKSGGILAAGEGEKLLFNDGRVVLLKVDEQTTGSQDLLMGFEHIPPGLRIPVHRHDGYEEILFVHRGVATLRLGEQEVEVEEGATMHVPPGTWHGVANTGDANATVLFIFPTTEMGDFFRRITHREGEPPRELSPEDWAEIMRVHQMAVPTGED